MSFNVELTEEETLCLHRYFERVDETEDLAFRHPSEYLALQRVARQICSAGAMKLSRNYEQLRALARGFIRPWKSLVAANPGFAHAGSSIGAGPSRHGANPREFAPDEAGFAAVSDVSDVRSIVEACVAAFEQGDVQTLAALFADDAHVFSPFFGYQSAREFLMAIMNASGSVRLTLHGIADNIEGRPQALGYFLREERPGVVEASGDSGEVFYYALNLDASGSTIQSMIILDA
jgi:hypothetical protein